MTSQLAARAFASPRRQLSRSPRRRHSISPRRPTKVPKTKSTNIHHEEKQPINQLQPCDDSHEEKPTLLSLDGLPLVLVLAFLVDAPDDVEKASSDYPPFRSVNRANELWERLFRSRWKDRFGYHERYGKAKSLFDSSSLSSSASPEFWYKQYYKAEADANRNTITVEELTSLTFSCRSWFDPLIKPPNWKKRHQVWMSGLRYSDSDQVKFSLPASESGWVTGHPSGIIRWYWQSNGSIINIENPRPSKFSTLRVRRLSNWGWELASDVIVLRAVDQASKSAIDALWRDYTSILIDQPIPVEAKKSLGRRYLNRWREIPNIPELMEKLPWNQWDDE